MANGNISPKYENYFEGLNVYKDVKEANAATKQMTKQKEVVDSTKNKISPQYQKYFNGLNITDGKNKSKEAKNQPISEEKIPTTISLSPMGAQGVSLKKEGTAAVNQGSLPAFGKGVVQGVKDVSHGIERFGNFMAAGRNRKNATPELEQKEEALKNKIANQQQEFQSYAQNNPIAAGFGRAVGQSAPFLPLSFGTGALLARGTTMAARAIPQGLISATEGATIAAGQSGNSDNIIANALLGLGVGVGTQAGGEILFQKVAPFVIRKANDLYTKITGHAPKKPPIDATGKATPEFEQTLQAEGKTMQDFTNETVEELKKTPDFVRTEDAIRQAKFKAIDKNFPTTKGDITQDFATKKKEAQLRETSDETGQSIRKIREDQSAIINQKLEELAENLGQGRQFNEIANDVLEGRLENLQRKKGALYKAMGDAADNSKPIPLMTNEIEAAIPKSSTVSDIADLVPAQKTAVDNLLVRYGINKDAEAVEQFLSKKGNEISPLTLNNLESFRKSLNRISKSDQTGAIDVIVGPIKKALDKEADFVAENIAQRNIKLEAVEKNASYLSPKELIEELPTDMRPKVEKAFKNLPEKEARELAQELIDYNKNPDAEKIIKLSKKAREIVKEIKTEFSPQSMSGRLINVKQDGVTPVIYSQQIYDQLLKPGKRQSTAGQLQQVMNNFEKSGRKGQNAIKALQSKVVLELIEEGFKDVSNSSSGKQLFNSGAFNKLLKNYGDKELNIVFKNNPQTLKYLKNIGEVGRLTSPSKYEAVKGSGNVILDIAQGFLKHMWIIKDLTAMIKFVHNKTATRNALKNHPRLKESYDYIKNTYPNLFNTLETAALNKEPSNKEKK